MPRWQFGRYLRNKVRPHILNFKLIH
jgi:hypothetical protein